LLDLLFAARQSRRLRFSGCFFRLQLFGIGWQLRSDRCHVERGVHAGRSVRSVLRGGRRLFDDPHRFTRRDGA
jgi:hypothetical protein